MLLRVLCSDKYSGFVEDYYLDDFISRGIVVAFYRPGSGEWVDPKTDQIRKNTNIDYKGPERRIINRNELSQEYI